MDNEEKPKAGDDKTQNLGNHESSNVDSRGSPNVDNDESSNVDSCGSPNADNDQSPNKGNHETPTAGNRELSASNQVWSKSKIFEEWRRFSFDLSPKVVSFFIYFQNAIFCSVFQLFLTPDKILFS